MYVCSRYFNIENIIFLKITAHVYIKAVHEIYRPFWSFIFLCLSLFLSFFYCFLRSVPVEQESQFVSLSALIFPYLSDISPNVHSEFKRESLKSDLDTFWAGSNLGTFWGCQKIEKKNIYILKIHNRATLFFHR